MYGVVYKPTRLARLLVHRRKIISSANLKLIISVFNYSYYYVQHSRRYHLLPQLGMLHLTLRAAWGWPTGLVHNFEILLSKSNHQAQEQPSSFGDQYCLLFKSRKELVAWVSVGHFKSKKRHSTFFSYKETGKITRDKPRTRTKFQQFLNKMPCSPFKQLIVSTSGLLQGLHMMSLAKSVPKEFNPQECKQTKLREPPPVPYIPKKDKVQEEVMNPQKLQIKTLLEKDTMVNFPVRHKNGTLT